MITCNSKKVFLLFIFNVMLCCVCFSQSALGIEWQNTIGGSATDYLYSIQQTVDGGYILGGWSASDSSGDKMENNLGTIGSNDYWIVKTDSTGNIQWQNTIGGDYYDYLQSVQQTIDGGYILGGWSYSNISGDKTENSSYWDYWIVKTDAFGDIQWQNTIGGSNDDRFHTLHETTDGGYILGGYSYSNISGDKTENSLGLNDYWIVKTDSTGNIQWQNTIGGDREDITQSIQQTNDGGYILGGTSGSKISGDKTENNIGSYDYWIVKTDSIGNIQWQNTIGGSNYDALSEIQQTADGGYILGGYSFSNISGDKTQNNWDSTLNTCDYWIVKTDSVCNIIWQKTIGGNGYDRLCSIQQTADGGYILGGYSNSNISGDKTENSCNNTADYWIVKIDAVGNIEWQNTIGASSINYFSCVRQTNDWGYILAGYSNSNISCDKTEDSLGGYDYWLIKLFPDTITSAFNLQNTTTNIQLFPNPAKEEVTIIINHADYISQQTTISVYDVMGNVVLRKEQSKTSNLKLQTSNLCKGIYLVEVKSNNSIYRSKLIKE